MERSLADFVYGLNYGLSASTWEFNVEVVERNDDNCGGMTDASVILEVSPSDCCSAEEKTDMTYHIGLSGSFPVKTGDVVYVHDNGHKWGIVIAESCFWHPFIGMILNTNS